jgi:hypothetical protein
MFPAVRVYKLRRVRSRLTNVLDPFFLEPISTKILDGRPRASYATY